VETEVPTRGERREPPVAPVGDHIPDERQLVEVLGEELAAHLHVVRLGRIDADRERLSAGACPARGMSARGD